MKVFNISKRSRIVPLSISPKRPPILIELCHAVVLLLHFIRLLSLQRRDHQIDLFLHLVNVSSERCEPVLLGGTLREQTQIELDNGS